MIVGKKNSLVLVGLIFILSIGCKTFDKKDKGAWDVDHYLLESQRNTSGSRYRVSIKLLHEVQQKFPNQDVIAVNYLIGYNYYSLNNYTIAETYLNKVFKLYEAVDDEYVKLKNKKFFVLASNILNMIDEKKEFDPYHIREEMDAKKKIKPVE